MKSNSVITLTNVSKSYNLARSKKALVNSFFKQNNQEQDFWALKNVNLHINKGDRIGIIGPNGAGKSTLLKIIAGISQPTSGKVQVTGKVVALMDLEAGFHPDLTGAENIYVNGMLIGMNKQEIDKNYKKILEFADIGDFIHAPFYTYSNGMKFRLAFAVAMASECEILIMDEVFMAGDYKFQQRVAQKLKSFQTDSKEITTIVCSHNPIFIWSFSKVVYKMFKGIIFLHHMCGLKKEIMEIDNVWREYFLKDL